MIRFQIAIPSGYSVVMGKAALRAVLRAAGAEVAGRARALIRSGGKSRASVPGQPPVSRTGTLAGSIKVRPSKDGESVAIRDVAFYALYLEAGAKGGGGNTKNRANILLAGETSWRGRVLREKNRMKRGAIAQNRILLPHPFLTTALDQVAGAGLTERVQAAVVSGLKFQRAKL